MGYALDILGIAPSTLHRERIQVCGDDPVSECRTNDRQYAATGTEVQDTEFRIARLVGQVLLQKFRKYPACAEYHRVENLRRHDDFVTANRLGHGVCHALA